MKTLTALVLLVLLPLAAAAAEPTVISGTVTTSADGLPLPGATVEITELGLSAVTDANGRYTLTVPAESSTGQEVTLRVSASGLRPKTHQVKLEGGAPTVDLGLGLGFHEDVVVGSRAIGAEAEKAVPVDILTARQIEMTGYTETAQVIQALAPSFNFPRPTITDGTDTVRPATLRGLGPDQVLVLINGKRRHQSALVHLNGSIGRGSTGVDLNAIPVSAIERIEVLRDGAAAQYGSDAIAGVINLVLKSGAQSASFGVRAGMNKGSFTGNTCNPAGTTCSEGDTIDFSDGELFDGHGTYGLDIGRGSLFIAAEYRQHDRTNRASFDPRDQVVPGDAGNNAVEQPNHRWGDPDTDDFMTFLNMQLPVDDAEKTFFYGFGGYSYREANSAGFYRRALDARNWPQIYPLGFLPEIQPTVVDGSATAGIRGARGDWFWDLSAEYGHNSFQFQIGNTLNTSLGPTIPPNQTDFDAGTLKLDQFVANFDLSRPLDIEALAGPLNVAMGAEFRHEAYQLEAGEVASYSDGGVRNQAGGVAALGAQVFPGFRPVNEVDESRSSVGLYLDLEGDVASRLRLGVAGRYEHYSDFGDTFDGKVTARIEATDKFVIRGSFSTGFRAPSLAQSYFSSTATNFLNVPGQGLVPFESLTMPVASAPARALGATDLEPEDSTHWSAGIVLSPTDSFDITVDYYDITIDRRIVLSGNFNQPQVARLLAPFGANSGRFFTNAIDTATNGVDGTVNYRRRVAGGQMNLQASYNWTETEITEILPTPPQLVGLEATLFDRIEQRRIECGQPRDNFRLGGDWRGKRWGGSLRTARYGEFCSFTLTENLDQTYEPKWQVDTEIGYYQDHWSLAVGSHNLFNTLPDRNITPNSFSGIQTFPSHAPNGMNGRFLYAEASYKF
jgi:iron complex outermembrane receptor protein